LAPFSTASLRQNAKEGKGRPSVNLDPQLLKILQEEYTHWKELPDGRIAAVCAGFTYGKARIMVGIDYIGYSDAY
jgi:hypothetical protein